MLSTPTPARPSARSPPGVPSGPAPPTPKTPGGTPRVRDLMTSPLVTCQRSDSCRDVARLMKKHDIGMLPVMEGLRAVGVVTDRDLVLRHVHEGGHPSEKVRVENCMTPRVVSVPPDVSLSEALSVMKKHDVRRVLVLDKGSPTGILSLDDILVHVGRSHEIGKVIDELLVQAPLSHWP